MVSARRSKKSSRRTTTALLQDYCRSLPGTTEDVKWETNLVFSVGKKMYAVFGLPEGEYLSFKTDPLVFTALTTRDGIEPAPYLARARWIRLPVRGVLPRREIEDLLQEAHSLVAAKLSKKLRAELGIV